MLVGLTGMGGGSLMTPILILVFGFKPTLAVGTDILHGAVFKSFGAVRHRRLGTVHARITFWMFLGSAPMSLLGVELADWLEQRYGNGAESASAKVIGGALVLGGIGFLAKTFVKRGVQPSSAPFLLETRDRVVCFALGASGGFIVGLTSVGSGTFFALVMLLVFPLTAAKIVGTDIFHAAALLWVAGVSHLLHGNVDRRSASHRARRRPHGQRRQAARSARVRVPRATPARRRWSAGGDGRVAAAERASTRQPALTHDD